MEPSKTPYYVEAIWDAEAEVFVSQSNVPGLVVEAASLDEFMQTVRELTPVLLDANDPAHAGQHSIRSRIRGELALARA
jgi:hypothetical protein